MFVLADDELFEFCVSCVKFGENRRVFVEFVGSVIFVDLKLSQNPLLPTTKGEEVDRILRVKDARKFHSIENIVVQVANTAKHIPP